MRYSDNYNLRLPQRGVDRANVDDLDSNFETIDGALADDRQIGLLMYDSTATYNTGAIRGYENPTTHRVRAYRCLEDGVTGPWDATKWAQTTLAAEIEAGGGGGGSSTLAGLSDVDLGTLADGEVLTYDATEGKWVNAAGGSGGASELSDLDDVSLTTPTEGQILTFDGDDWVNADAPDVDVTKTAEGNPIEISDSANAPLVKCVSAITGSQDLHGQDKPWVGGAGKNKYGNGDKTFVQAMQNIVLETPLSAGTYTFSALVTSTDTDNEDCLIQFMSGSAIAASGRITRSQGSQVGVRKYLTLTWSEGTVDKLNLYAAASYANGAGDTASFTDIQIESGSTATSYEPYSNICPITAYTEGEIEVRGFNLFDGTYSANNKYLTTSGVEQSYNGWNISDYIKVDPSTTYHFHNLIDAASSAAVCLYDADKNFISGHNVSKDFNVTTTPTTSFVRCSVRDYMTEVCVNKSSSKDGTYEPYTSTTHATTFTNSIYQGEADFVEKSATAEKVLFEFTSGVELYGNYGDENAPLFYITLPKNVVKYTKPDPTVVTPISNVYNANTASTGQGMHDFEFRTNNNTSSNTVYFRDSRFTTASEVNAHIANNPLQFVFTLYASENEQISVSNAPIKSLSGYSHLESSTGDMEIAYITGKYNPIIEIAERETKTIDEMLTENIESSMTASQNYTTGELIIACGKIYRVTANIASGSSLTVGTNVTQTTIEAEIARSGGGANYSTTEHVVGTWIDGSTVYEKTFSFSIPSNNYTTETTGITNFDKCVGYSGIVALGNGYYEDINYGRPDSSNSTYYIAITSTGDIFFKTYEASSGTAYITMRYTKSS